MSGYLLDTNVVSEIFREAPDFQVRSFLAGLLLCLLQRQRLPHRAGPM